MKKNAVIISLVALVFFFIILRWNSVNAPLIRDEGEYAYAAQLLLKGNLPYVEAFIQKPPLIIYSYAVAQILHLGIYWGPRVLADLCLILATLLLGHVVKRDFGTRAGLIAMWLFTIMVFQAGFEQFTANVEMFLVLPLMGVVALYQTKKDRGCGLVAGFLTAAAVLYKPTALLPLIFLLGVWLYEKRTYRLVVEIILGGLLGIVLSLGYFWWRGGLSSLLTAVITYNQQYVLAGAGGLAGFWQYFLQTAAAWWPVVLLLIWYLYARPQRWWFYLGLFVTAVIGTGGGLYSHYFIPATLFLAAITAIAIETLSVKLAQDFQIKIFKLGLAITAIVLLVIAWPAKDWVFLSPAEFSAKKYSNTPFAASPQVAAQVAALTAPSDFVLVAGSEPQILYYANRLSSTRFITFYPLFISTPLASVFQAEAKGEIEARPPKLIVFSNSNSSWLLNQNSPRLLSEYLDRLLSSKYQLLSDSEANQGGLLIFKKID